MDREQKTAVVEQLAGELKDSTAIFAVDYRGISVPQAAELREGLREADTRFRIVKNRLTLRAADESGTGALKDHLTGPTALALVKGDAALAAKTLSRLGTEWELLDYKGGLMDGEELDPDSFKAIARLPGRDALNAQIAGVVASPLTGLVRGLGSMIQGLALQLGQIAEQGLVTGEAPAEEAPAEEAPAEEAPAEEAPAEEEEAEEASSDGEAEAPAAQGEDVPDESPPDPDPADSPEETTEEKAPEGEETGQDEGAEPAETGEGDQDIGEEPAADESAGGTEEAGGAESETETSEDSDENKEGGS
jgi:large subunit ribosomal protein L10